MTEYYGIGIINTTSHINDNNLNCIFAKYNTDKNKHYHNYSRQYENLLSNYRDKPIKYLVCGGGRKNTFLIQSIKDYLSHKQNISLNSIDDYSLNGDYIESQAFGYLSIRSFLNLPISYPKTTGCKTPTVGGELVKNF